MTEKANSEVMWGGGGIALGRGHLRGGTNVVRGISLGIGRDTKDEREMRLCRK
jgi:hypothetical protein